MSNIAKNTVKSTWTPLNNEEANQKWKQLPTAKIFEERRTLVTKWFEKWTDGQRRVILADLLEKCKVRQIEYAGEIVNRKKPVLHEDFTRCLPRVLSIYIFSFLDPRSLCRSSQVCWFWKYLCELDQLWMPKCMKLGWILPFSPSPYEAGVWKRLYIENIVALKCLTPKVAKDVRYDDSSAERPDSRSSKYTPRRSVTGSGGRRPWRGSDPVPQDIWRNNILSNDDETDKVNKLRKKGGYGKEIQEVTMKATTRINANTHPGKRPSSVPRSKSVPGLNDMYKMHRPDWAKSSTTNGAPFANKSHLGDTDPRAATQDGTSAEPMKRPPPVTTLKVAGKSHRTPRDPPSSNLFPEQPWKVPDEDEYDSDVY